MTTPVQAVRGCGHKRCERTIIGLFRKSDILCLSQAGAPRFFIIPIHPICQCHKFGSAHLGQNTASSADQGATS